MSLEKAIINKAKGNDYWIVLPEAQNCDRVLQAGLNAVKKKICNVIFLGDERLKQFESEKIKVINPKTFKDKTKMVNLFFELRKNKGLTLSEAKKFINDNSYFAVMLVKMGLADGVVNGAITPSRNVIKPALQIIKGAEGIETVSSCFLMIGKKNNFVFSDCGLVEEPTSNQLCDIAISSAKSCESFLLGKPKVGLVSYSTLGSGKGESVDKIKQALIELKKRKVKFEFDGEFQVDSAICPKVAIQKAPKSKIAGSCNCLVFPNLDSGNIGYKLYQQASGCLAIGPILQGLNKPINDLSRGASVKEIVLQIAITVIQRKEGEK